MTEPKTNGVCWSDVVRRIEAGEPVPRLAGEERLHPLAAVTSAVGPATAPPPLDLDEDPPVPPPARAYAPEPVPAPPSRRGWLLRAIEGVFG